MPKLVRELEPDVRLRVARYLNVDAVRVTSVEAFAHCQRKWSAEVSGEVKRESGYYARVGTAVHSAVERYLAGTISADLTDLSGVDMTREYLRVEGVSDEEVEHLRRYLTSLAPLLPLPKVLEHEVEFELVEGALPIRGHLDALFKLSDEEALVLDHKTNRRWEGPDVWAARLQPRLYAHAVRRLYGFKQVRFRIGYVNLETCVDWVTDPDDGEALREYYQWMWDTLVEATVFGDFAERVHEGCGYCLLRDRCRSFNAQLGAYRDAFESVLAQRSLAERYLWVQEVRKAATRMEEQLKEEAVAKLQAGEALHADGRALVLYQGGARKGDPRALLDLLEDGELSAADLEGVLTVKVTELDKLAKRRPDLTPALEATIAHVPFEQPSLRTVALDLKATEWLPPELEA